MAQNACFWKSTFTGMQSHPFISVSFTAALEPQWQKYGSEIIWSANDTWPFKKMSTDLWTTGYFKNAFYIAYSKNFLVKFLERRKGILFRWDNYNSKWHVLIACFCFDKNRLVIRLGLFTGCWAVQLPLLYHGCLFHTHLDLGLLNFCYCSISQHASQGCSLTCFIYLLFPYLLPGLLMFFISSGFGKSTRCFDHYLPSCKLLCNNRVVLAY